MLKLDYVQQAPAGAAVVFCHSQPQQSTVAGPYEMVVKRLADQGRLKTKVGAVKLVEQEEGPLFLVGAGEREELLTPGDLKQIIAAGIKAAREEGILSPVLLLDSLRTPLPRTDVLRAAGEAAVEADYTFDRYLTKKDGNKLQQVTLVSTGDAPSERAAMEEGEAMGRAVCLARDLVNIPSREMTPLIFAHRARELAQGKPYELELLDAARLEEIGAHGLLAVSAGAPNAPCMLVLRYRGDPEHPQEITGLIGKGVTYDSGGYSLKSKTGMITMHHDMAGAAAALCAFDLCAQRGVRANLTALLPLCENMLDAASYRPGDIIPTLSGKTVLIKSTDAEGRLLLADGMTYAIQAEQVTRLVDIATLTGGAVAAFGSLISAVATNSEPLRQAVNQASLRSGEMVWEMPLPKEYRRSIQAEQADLVNSVMGNGSSMITAALFLEEFTQSLPWLHIDTAGPSWTTKPAGCQSYGATGAGVGLLYALVHTLATC